MNLHDQYETLLGRGMSEVDGLHWMVRYDGHEGAWVVDTPDRKRFSAVEESVARDLITMHALRWAQSLDAPDHSPLPTDPSTADMRYAGISRLTYAELKAHADDFKFRPPLLAWPVYDLDTILAATEHLEPTNGTA